jgi:hypothetical protein
MTRHWPSYYTPAQRQHAADSWAALVSGALPYHCACGNPCDTTHRRNNDELMCADCAQDESNRENRWEDE